VVSGVTFSGGGSRMTDNFTNTADGNLAMGTYDITGDSITLTGNLTVTNDVIAKGNLTCVTGTATDAFITKDRIITHYDGSNSYNFYVYPNIATDMDYEYVFLPNNSSITDGTKSIQLNPKNNRMECRDANSNIGIHGHNIVYLDGGTTITKFQNDGTLGSLENTYIRIGDGGSYSYMDGDGDLCVEDELEVKGLVYFSTGTALGGKTLAELKATTPDVVFQMYGCSDNNYIYYSTGTAAAAQFFRIDDPTKGLYD